MTNSIRPTRIFRSTGSKAVLTLACAALLSGMAMTPACADDNHGHGARQEHRDKHDRHGYHPGYGYQPPYTYAQPVYVPPPVYYEPQQSPGISLFFPLDFRR